VGVIDASGTVQRILLHQPVGHVSIITGNGDVIGVPFPNRTLRSASPSGRAAGAIHATMAGDAAGTFSVTAVRLDGHTVFTGRHGYSSRKIESTVLDSVLRRHEQVLPPGLRAEFRARYRAPEEYPPLNHAVVSDERVVLVGPTSAGQTRDYLLISGDQPLEVFQLSSRSRVVAVSGDAVWIVERDEDGVESLVGYGLRR
jgi:hypothetical protein